MRPLGGRMILTTVDKQSGEAPTRSMPVLATSHAWSLENCSDEIGVGTIVIGALVETQIVETGMRRTRTAGEGEPWMMIGEETAVPPVTIVGGSGTSRHPGVQREADPQHQTMITNSNDLARNDQDWMQRTIRRGEMQAAEVNHLHLHGDLGETAPNNHLDHEHAGTEDKVLESTQPP
mmetsp:Transcript_16736/g.27171  ORF Transcript_16736/g.27171 Transcript_16736/m.27171 type:complete len:178 (+) Transcript_16736:1601-2134(+)